MKSETCYSATRLTLATQQHELVSSVSCHKYHNFVCKRDQQFRCDVFWRSKEAVLRVKEILALWSAVKLVKKVRWVATLRGVAL